MTNFYKALVLAMLMVGTLFAQSTIEGTVTGPDGEALVGVNIVVDGTTIGTTSGTSGEYSLTVSSLPATVVFEYVGYKTQTVTVTSESTINVTLDVDILSGDDVLIVGSRFHPRTSITSPVPIDNIKLRDLKNTSQITFDKMMHYTVPSFNSTQQTISDATAHFDPADLRGLGPSRTLVLVNGKRKNPSALVYINDTPGKGDVGVDMHSIPTHAIERVEVLRDGASAQYGSDAIAGVINIILNDDTESTTIDAYSGITQEGDGLQIGGSVSRGFEMGESGFINLSAGMYDHEETDRGGEPGEDLLFGADGSDPFIQDNPDLGMTVGLPNMQALSLAFNAGNTFENGANLYAFGTVTRREGLSYALYRTPYWVTDDFGLLTPAGETYNGFQPTFETTDTDQFYTIGVTAEKSGWDMDFSVTHGSNKVDYFVDESINLGLGADSPTSFDPGGYEFSNNIANIDVSRQLNDMAYLTVGGEFRQEKFVANAGEEASYFVDANGTGGAQSFPGLQPQNAVEADRSNVGAYADLGIDVSENVFIGGAARFENYSDFGTSTTFKVNGRYKTSDNRFTLRGSASTGFRAPSLHQIHLSIIQTLISGGTVSNQGTFANDSPVLRELGVDELKEENALNMTLGIAGRPADNFYVSADVFRIAVDDRIVYSSSIFSTDPTTTTFQVLQDNNITSLKFFINAVNTITTGMDLVARYEGENYTLNAAATFYDHEIDGTIATPDVLAADGVDIFDRKEQSRIVSSRPNQKIIVGGTYDIDALTLGLSANYFGEVTWMHVDNGLNGADLGDGPLPTDDAAYDQTFAAKTLLDANISYQVTDNVAISVLVNNLLDTYPDEIDTKGDFVTDLGGRFLYPWEVNQFGFNGRVFMAALNLNL